MSSIVTIVSSVTAGRPWVTATGSSAITSKASGVGQDILATTVVVAIVAAFFTQAQRRLMVVGSILLLGGFAFMIVGDPTATLTSLGHAIKSALWDPIMSALGGN